MTTTTTIYADQTYPPMMFAWDTRDASGNVVLWNFTGWTLSVEVVNPTTNTIVFTKTSGVAGGPGTGLSNVAITWTVAELTQIVGSTYKLRIVTVNNADTTKRDFLELDNLATLPRLRVLAKPV
jgi:hypothetical protein